MKNLIKNHPVTAYYTMAFGWTWIIVFGMIFSGTVDVTTPSPLFIIGGILCNISPSIAAFIVTRITEGKEGVKRLKAGYSVKNSFKWYALAILTVPILTILTTLISHYTLRPYSFKFTAPLLAMGLVWPLFSSHGEEFGWRGFIFPKLLTKHSPLKAAIILGIIWEIWHVPMHYMAYKDYGAFMIPAFLTVGFINLTLQTVIMTYIFTRTQRSIKLMVLYHYTITSSSILVTAFLTAEATPQFTVYESLISIALFTIVAALLYLRKKPEQK